MGEYNYNLKGLKLVFIGLIIQVAASVFSGGSLKSQIQNINVTSTQSSNVDGLSIIMGIISFAGLILMIVGLSKVKSYSANFLRSRNYYIINIFLGAATVIIAVIMAGVAVSSLSTYSLSGSVSTGNGIMIVMGIVIIGMTVAMAIIGLLAVRGLMLGCSDIARANGDEYLAGKCSMAWKLFLIATLITIVSVVVLVIAAIVSLASAVGSGNLGYGYQMGMAGGLIAVVLIVVGALIFLLVAQIIMLVRIWNTYSRFNGKSISTGAGTVNMSGFAQGEWVHVGEPEQAARGPIVNGTELPPQENDPGNTDIEK